MAHVGIDIGGSSIKAVRLCRGDTPRAEARVAYAGTSMAALRDAVRDASASIGFDTQDSVGVCLPGLVDPERGVLVHAANLPCLVGESPADLIADILGVQPTRVHTDATAWGLGVARRETGIERLLVVAIGSGVGAALIVNGKPVTLDGTTPGHVGMIDVSLDEADPPRAGDGTPGVLEAYIGGRALAARFGTGDLAGSIAGLSADDSALLALAKGLRICHAIYKPDAVRLVGGVGALLRPHLPGIESIVGNELTSVARGGWTLGVVDDLYLAAEGVAMAGADR